MKDNIRKRIEIYETLCKTGKCLNKSACVSPSNLYKFVKRWKEIGLIEVKRDGRSLDVIVTDKGKRYLNYLVDLRGFSDFFL